MMLSDMGAEVVRVERCQSVRDRAGDGPGWDVLNRGRRNLALDLKNPDGIDALLRLVEKADALVEGFRPGVTERLGVGPDACLARNPKLVYGRMTGWGQEGPYAHAAGHDINYIALAGALAHFGRARRSPDAAAEHWSATSAAEACCWPSAWSARSWKRSAAGRARSSTPRWSTVPRC